MDAQLRKESDILVLCDRDGTTRDARTNTLLPGVQELFSGLAEANATIVIVTAGTYVDTSSFLSNEGLERLITLILPKVGELDRCRTALAEAERSVGIKFNPQRVFVIDDDYNIIQQAHQLGLRTIGVGTGYSDVSQFKELSPRPTAVFSDLGDTKAVLQVILGKDAVQRTAKDLKSKSTR
jgi:phosphoglycolate phosphatase-like HAD superfamily hydrolase